MDYDSKADTLEHIHEVAKNLYLVIQQILIRASHHDASKLLPPEKIYFDMLTPKLEKVEYGSDEYKKMLNELEPAITHHIEINSHHPEHYKNGIDGMDIIDIVEMFCDWAAAVKRNKNGDIKKSLEINRKRFNMSDQLYHIFLNTIERRY